MKQKAVKYRRVRESVVRALCADRSAEAEDTREPQHGERQGAVRRAKADDTPKLLRIMRAALLLSLRYIGGGAAWLEIWRK